MRSLFLIFEQVSRSPSRASSKRSGTSRTKQANMTWTSEMMNTCAIRGNVPFENLAAPILDIKCMSSLPVAVVSCGDGGKNGTLEKWKAKERHANGAL